MTIDLSKDLEKIVHDAVRTGLYAREDDVIRDALIRLKQSLPQAAQTSGKGAKCTKAAPRKPKQPITEEEFLKHLVEIGLMTEWNPPQATRLQPVVRRVSPVGL